MGGGLAFAALALVAAGLHGDAAARYRTGGDTRGIGRDQGSRADLLADFENRASDSTLGPSRHRGLSGRPLAVTNRSGHGPAGDLQALARMQRPATARCPLALARELAEREGVKAIVSRADRSGGAGLRARGEPDFHRRWTDAERGARNGRRPGRAAQGHRSACRRSSASGSASR